MKKSASSKKLSRTTAKILSSEMIYEGPVFGLRRDQVVEPSGLQVTREVITHPGSVVVFETPHAVGFA